MKKIDVFDTFFKIVLIAVAVVCLFMMFLGGGLRDKKPAASTTASSDTAADPGTATDTLPAIDCECYPDSVVEDGYGTFYHHPGQDPEWTTVK